jgi:asparagine synthase (glutamine-hydrolysing)
MNPPNSLCLGEPEFADPESRAIAARSGPAAAWLDLWQRLGAREAAARVRGAFALAARDERGRVLLAVDRFAIRSLCLRLNDGTLHFAERADQLADSDAALDLQAIYDYLYFHVIPSPRTIFAGVSRLPAGHFALFEEGRLTVEPYWQPRFEGQRGQADFGALKAEFLTLLEAAAARVVDRSRPACFLSGGTDSSTVAGMLGRACGKPAATFSIGFEAQGYDEMEFARITARHFGTEHHEYYVTPADIARGMADVAGAYDQPFGNSSVLPAYHCALMAREHGVSRLLAGDGGDELFGGNSRYAKQGLFDLYRHVPGFVRGGLLEPVLSTGLAARVPLTRKAASYVEQARVPMPDRMQMYNLLHRLGETEVLTPGFLAAVDPGLPLQAQRGVWAASDGAHLVDRQLAFDWRYTLAECDLPKVCGSTALAGLATGFPLLDDDLLAFSLRLPPEYKLRGSTLRWFFKEALRGFLPEATITKKKQGFGLPFGVWAASDAALGQLAAQTLSSLATRGIVQPAFISTLLSTHLRAHPGYYGEMVWILMMLELWLQRHVPRFALGR